MLVLWMGYAILVGVVVACAGALFERGIRRRRRFLWAGVQLLAVLLPMVRPVLRRLGASNAELDVVFGPIGPVIRGAIPTLQTLGGAAAASRTLADVQGPLLGAWLGASVVLALVVLAGVLRVRRLRRDWRPERVDGLDVLVSKTLGPAVVGVLKPAIVLPEWVMELPATQRAMVLAHEEEHRRSGDPRLLAASLVVPVLMPWNPVAWIAWARLREAVELDCDARVLRQDGRKRVHYARLLFEVSTRHTDAVPVGAGFGERASSVERRIRTLLSTTMRFGWKGLAIRFGAAGLLLTAACSLEVNIKARPSDDTAAATPAADEVPPAEPVPGLRDPREGAAPIERPATPVIADPKLAETPVFTPFTVAPSIQNRGEVIKAMEAEYPPLLREAGVGGTVKVYFFIDAEGVVKDMRIDQGSGHQALDDAALRVAKVYHFSPALNRDQKVPVWVSFPITFQMAR